ncbi:MAG: hypothetical protein JSR45_01970 [Proteobacteria bacterium]|nr:hypothetical protein [Pseudomonadota bacterium]
MASTARFNPFARPTVSRGYQATSFEPIAAHAGPAPAAAATAAPMAAPMGATASDELPMNSVLARTTNKTRSAGGKRNVAPLLIGAGVLALAAVAAGVIVNMSGKRQPLVAQESVDDTAAAPAPASTATPVASTTTTTTTTKAAPAAVAASSPRPVAVRRAAAVRSAPVRSVTPRAAETPSVSAPVRGPAAVPLQVTPTPSVPATTTDSIPQTPPIEPPANPTPQTQSTPQTPPDTVPHL